MKRGFTLIETVIAVAITVFLFLGLAVLFVAFMRLYREQQAAWNTRDAVGITLRALEDAVIPASHVLATRSFSGTTYATSGDVLVLELPSVDDDGSIESGKYDYAAFYLSDGIVYRITSADASSARVSGTRALGRLVTGLSFSYDAADVTQATIVTATVAASSSASGASVAEQFSESIRLRNL
jgi:type II secretory pathway pseudopilin PulG